MPKGYGNGTEYKKWNREARTVKKGSKIQKPFVRVPEGLLILDSVRVTFCNISATTGMCLTVIVKLDETCNLPYGMTMAKVKSRYNLSEEPSSFFGC